ncbi:hypothetical protein C6P77_04680 [Burkholderia ambifaria]|nr:hypothetical protein C6P77_04680 [Burkholderia ambifaria]
MNAVEVMPRAERRTGVAGVDRGRLPCRRAPCDGAVAARAPPAESCGGHTPAPSRIGTSLSIHVH